MYEIDLSTYLLIGIDKEHTKVITSTEEFVIEENCNHIINNSCQYFGSTLRERINFTNRIVKMKSKAPIIIEDTRNIIFFPIKSIKEDNNIWISYNNLETYEKIDKNTRLIFKNKSHYILDYSYYIIDNQVTRSLILDYEIIKRRKSLEK